MRTSTTPVDPETRRSPSTRQLVAGTAIAFTGVVVIAAATSSRQDSDTWGVLLCVAAAVAYSIAVVAQRPLLASLPAPEVTWLACTIGAVVCLPFAPRGARLSS